MHTEHVQAKRERDDEMQTRAKKPRSGVFSSRRPRPSLFLMTMKVCLLKSPKRPSKKTLKWPWKRWTKTALWIRKRMSRTRWTSALRDHFRSWLLCRNFLLHIYIYIHTHIVWPSVHSCRPNPERCGSVSGSIVWHCTFHKISKDTTFIYLFRISNSSTVVLLKYELSNHCYFPRLTKYLMMFYSVVFCRRQVHSFLGRANPGTYSMSFSCRQVYKVSWDVRILAHTQCCSV